MIEWNIQSRAHVCEACGHGFADRQPYYTLLFDERAGLRRQDICAACWAKDVQAVQERPDLISRWQGVYEAPPARPVDPIQKDTAETLLRKLTDRNDPRYAPAAYILAVMLERKRLLKVKEQIEHDGRRVFIYEQPRTGDLFTIADPQLHLDQLEQVQHDVAHLLEHGLPAEGGETHAPAENPTEAAGGEGPAPAEAGPVANP
jgi:hypothetical protein